MSFFRQYFKDTVFEGPEVAVCCPFPHKDENGNDYIETRPSAHVNTEKGTLHCKVCGQGWSETKFLSEINGISYREARKLLSSLEKSDDDDWNKTHQLLLDSHVKLVEAQKLGFSEATLRELKVGFQGSGFSFPVFMYGELLDVRKYVPNGKPKVTSVKGANSNLIIPFDVWREDDRDTFLMAGEKDMALARSLGYNAITFTGGEQAFPKLFKHSFKNRNVYIVYDNDAAGQTGARKTATLLKEVGATPYIVTGHHEIATEKGGDFHDYIMKYNKTKEDFDKVIENVEVFTEVEYKEEKEKIVPTVSLIEATRGEYRNRLVRSSVQVTATFDQSFGISDYIEVEKVGEVDGTSKMEKGEIKEWTLDDENVGDILKLMDSNLKEKDVDKNLRALAGVPASEKGTVLRKLSHNTVFKANVTDLIESGYHSEDEEKQPLELTVYTIGKKLKSGMKYKLTYKVLQHPLQNQEMVMLVTDIEESDDTVSAFKVTPKVMETLKVFQGDPDTKMEEIFNRGKGLLGAFANRQIFFGIDLFYHTPLEFTFGRFDIRGYLDVFILGDTRTGKSHTADTLLKTYQLGTISSLKNSSVAGLIGGSNKVNGSFKTTIGTIPKNHKGAVIFEEFSGADPRFIKSLTDIRSSNQIRITRVNGELNLPAYVRMLTLSNQKPQSDGKTKQLRNYPNGVHALVDLIGASEDIARYDFFVLAGESEDYDDPLAIVDDPFSSEAYKNRIRWVWSRSKEQITFAEGVDRYIVDRSKELNEDFNTNIKFFGAEAWKKLSRLAVSVAASVVSCDETGEKLIVKKEHVDWAVKFFGEIYDNDLFRLKQYVQEQKRYTIVDNALIKEVQEMYSQHTILLSQMEMTSSMSQRNLQAISGKNHEEFNQIMKRMAQFLLIQWQGDKIVPSERFRKAMVKIDRNIRVKEVGEV